MQNDKRWFFIIGAQKSGTTSLYHYLKSHPQVFLPSVKEINYFAYDDKKIKRKYWATTLDDYLNFYKSAKNDQICGEVTPAYLNSDVAAMHIKSFNPNSKIIAILRNPIERFVSAFEMAVRDQDITHSIDDVIQNPNNFFIETGMYYQRLMPYYQLFSPNQIKIFLFDELEKNADNLLKELYDFLEINNDYLPDTEVKHTVGYKPKYKILHRMMTIPFLRYRIKPLLPPGIFKIVNGIKKFNSGQREKLSVVQKSKLMNIYQSDINKLEKLINKDLNQWLV